MTTSMGLPVTDGHRQTAEEWATPPALFADLNDEFGFDLDPAAAHWNAKCADYYTRKEDGLEQQWYGAVFMNPPYGRQIPNWVQKAYDEWPRAAVDTVVALLPARTDPQWFHKYIYKQAEIRFLPGRIYFVREDGSTGRSPWGSMVVVWE